MPSMKQFKLPDVGEGLTEAEILTWYVKPGDTVKVNQIVVEIETAKSLVELPCPFAGVVDRAARPRGHDGRRRHADHRGRRRQPAAGAPPRRQRRRATTSAPARPGGPDDPSMIGTAGRGRGGRARPDRRSGAGRADVGAGRLRPAHDRRPRAGRARARHAGARRSRAAARAAGRATSMLTTPTPVREPELEHAAESAPAHTVGDRGRRRRRAVLAKPPVRKLAKDLGVDLDDGHPVRPGGIVTRDDVDAAAGAGEPRPPAGGPAPREPRRRAARDTGAGQGRAQDDRAGDGRQRVHRAARHRVRHGRRDPDDGAASSGCEADREFRDVKVSPLLSSPRRCCSRSGATRTSTRPGTRPPQEIVVKHYVNLGIAAATPRGLIVPNIKDADAMSLPELAEALDELVETAREGRTQPADMAGGTITITNVGVFGVDTGTPILNPGESAILCFGAVRDMPWVVDGKIVVRAGDAAGAVLRPPAGRRRARLEVPGRRRPRAGGPGDRAGLVSPTAPASG